MTDDVPADTETGGLRGHLIGAGQYLHDALASKIDDRKTAHVTGLLETFEADIAPLVAPFVAKLVADPSTPPEVRDLLGVLTGPQHFGESIVIGIAIGALLSPMLSAAIQPTVQALANSAWSESVSGPVTGGTVPLSPVELAAGVLKDVFQLDYAQTRAAESGVSASDMERLVTISGQSMGFEAALSLARRGLLVNVSLDEVLQYSNVNKKFYASMLNLITEPASLGSVLEGRIKNHLDDPTAYKLYVEAGGDPANYQWQRDTVGRPPGVMEMLRLWNRMPEITQLVDDAIAQSDLALHFQEIVKELRWYIPPVRSIMAMLRGGAIDDTKATVLFTENGVRPTDIPDYLKEAHHSRTAAVKELSVALVTRMYEARLLDEPTARARIIGYGYSDADATLMLGYADDARHERALNSAITKVGTLYVGHKLDRAGAVNALGEYAIPTAAQHDLLATWDIERTAAAPNLSVAQYQGSLRRGLISHAEFDAAMAVKGYDANEIALLAGLAFPPPRAPAAPKVHHLTVSEIIRLYTAHLIDRPTASANLTALGYSLGEATELLALADSPKAPVSRDLTVAQLIKLYHSGNLTLAAVTTRLADLGYSPTEVQEILTIAGPPPAAP